MNNNTKIIELSKYSPLTKDKKEILESHVGSASSAIDMNKVKEW
ncbi:hypothetical protein [Paenibacillus silvae]|nr:hypothetical protein [Paenibacillus silvae]